MAEVRPEIIDRLYLRAIRTLFRGVARTQLLVLFLEDLYWADRASIEFRGLLSSLLPDLLGASAAGTGAAPHEEVRHNHHDHDNGDHQNDPSCDAHRLSLLLGGLGRLPYACSTHTPPCSGYPAELNPKLQSRSLNRPANFRPVAGFRPLARGSAAENSAARWLSTCLGHFKWFGG